MNNQNEVIKDDDLKDNLRSRLESELEQKLEEYNVSSELIENLDTLIEVHDLFINNVIYEISKDTPDISIKYNFLSVYYETVMNDRNKMIEYSLEAYKLGCSTSVLNLGRCYEAEKDYTEMEKYYLMASEHGNSEAMLRLASYYNIYHDDIVLMKKYLLMATEHDNTNAMLRLANYYYNEKNEMDLAKKYWLMAVKHGDTSVIQIINNYYLYEGYERDDEYMIKFLYYADEKYLCPHLKLAKRILSNQMTELEMHCKYTVNEVGYEEAREDLLSNLSSD